MFDRSIPQHPDFIPFDKHLPYEVDRLNNESQHLSKFRLAQLVVSLIAASAASLPISASAAALFVSD